VRELFDSLIEDYGEDFEFYLSADSETISSPKFEKAIVKAIREETLNDDDHEELKILVINDDSKTELGWKQRKKLIIWNIGSKF
jgi:hypothetical protein